MTMSKKEQKVEKSKFTKDHTQAETNRIKDAIPGPQCACCKPKARADKGKTRERNKATTKPRKSKRVQGEDPVMTTTTKNEEAYVSMGHNKRRRLACKPQPRKKYKRQKKMEHARSIQMQGSEPVMRELDEAIKKVIGLLTRCTMPPTRNPELNVDEYNQTVARHRILLASVNEVAETRMNGSRVPEAQLR